jgi:hypothetical protein
VPRAESTMRQRRRLSPCRALWAGFSCSPARMAVAGACPVAGASAPQSSPASGDPPRLTGATAAVELPAWHQSAIVDTDTLRRAAAAWVL